MRGFSLVELSIVLVILGLLVGGILAGQSLIRASELRSTMGEITKVDTAIYAFRDRYFSLPGDFTQAQTIWGTDADGCPTHTNRIAKTTTCNGNGDGRILGADYTEAFRAWQHLSNAGLIEGQFTGVEGVNTASFDNDPGVNVPSLPTATDHGITLYHQDSNFAAGGYRFNNSYGNVLAFGRCSAWDCVESGFPPSEAWQIDTKLDDGRPGSGKLITRAGINIPGGHINCNTATSGGGNGAEANALYSLDNTTTKPCAFYYIGRY